MNVYIVGLFFFICLLTLFLERTKNIRISPWIVMPFYLIIIAFSNTPDTEAYKEFFRWLNTDISDIDGAEFAIGFQIASKLLKTLVGNNFNLYLSLLTGLNLLIVILSIKLINSNATRDYIPIYQDIFIGKHLKSYFLPIVIYFSYFGLYYNSIAIRANIALSILFLITAICSTNIKFIFKIIYTILLFFLSMTFHSTAIIGIPVLIVFFLFKNYTLKTYLLIWILVGLFYLSGLSELFVRKFIGLDFLNVFFAVSDNDGISEIAHYRDQVAINNNISFRYIFLYLLGFFVLKYKNNDAVYFKYLNVYFFGLVLGAFFNSMETFGRVLDYFSFYSFVLIWFALESKKMTSRGFVINCTIIILLQLVFVFRLINGN